MVVVSVVVLGDIGHSPRMQYHAISLAENGHRVDLIGYQVSRPHRLVVENDQIQLHHLAECPPPPKSRYVPTVLGLIWKCLWQAVTLFWCLAFTVPKMDAVLLQNPPGLPTLFVCWLAARIRRAKFVVDWHNYTWSILALTWNKEHPLVRLVRWYEYTVGGWADYGLCVSERMKQDLCASNPKFGARAGALRVFYDRPRKNVFRPIESVQERNDVMMRMEEYHEKWFCVGEEYFDAKFFGAGEEEELDQQQTDDEYFTYGSTEWIDQRSEEEDLRPALLITSTSWTADEDFDMLFRALDLCELASEPEFNRTPDGDPIRRSGPILLVITGKGPLKHYYLNQRRRLWRDVRVCAPWLSAEDYPRLLACADLGLCLHTSSSGLDLPMKVVDMLGAGVPVAAVRYPCIGELVKEGQNGFIFDDAQALAQILLDLFPAGGYGQKMMEGDRPKLKQMKRQMIEEMKRNEWSWEANWNEVVKPLFSTN